MTFKQGLLIFVLGAAAGVGFTCFGTNRRIAAVKRASADSTKVALARDSAVTAFADSLAARVDSLQKAKRPVAIKIVRDSTAAAQADSALREAKTASDSNMALVVEVASLLSEVQGLKENAAADSLSLFAAMARGNALQDSLHAQTRTIVGLNQQIQRLNQHVLPKWFRVSFDLIQKGFAVKGIVDVVRGR